MEVINHMLEDFDAVIRRAGLCVRYMFPADIRLHVSREVACVSGHEVIVKRHGVWHKFDNARGGGQWQDLVGADAEVSLPGSSLGFEQRRDLIEDLLHDGILAEIIVATLEELLVFFTVGTDGGDDLGHADTRCNRELRGKAGDHRDTAVVAIRAERCSESGRGDPLVRVEDIRLEALACR